MMGHLVWGKWIEPSQAVVRVGDVVEAGAGSRAGEAAHFAKAVVSEACLHGAEGG